jgi:uncharacterized protein with HEPN domain
MRLEAKKYLYDIQNTLIHGYADVDDRVVWDVVETKLPVLRREIEALLSEAEARSARARWKVYLPRG